MEIQKIFSDSYDEERIYSVLMDEEELSLFSEIQKEFTGAVKAANKAAKRAWEMSQGQRTGLSKIIKGKLPESEAIRAGRKLNDMNQGFRGFTIDKKGNHVFDSLNQKINEKATGASYARLNHGVIPSKRGIKTTKRIGYDHEANSYLVDGKTMSRSEFLKPNVMGKIRK